MAGTAIWRKRFRRGLLLAVGLLFFASGMRAQETGGIAGEIRMEDGQWPDQRIPVSLEIRGAPLSRQYADSEGHFGFFDLLPNTYYVVVELEGYQPVRTQVVLNPFAIQTMYVRILLRPKSRTDLSAPGGSVDIFALSKKYPSSVWKEYEAGRKLEERGDSGAAAAHYEAALRIAEDFYPARTRLAARRMGQGDWRGAEEQLREVLRINPNYAEALILLANVLYLTNHDEEARKTSETAIRLAPTSALGYYVYGSVLARQGEYALAERELKTAREYDPKMPQATLALATVYLQQRRDQDAIAEFERFLKQFPKHDAAEKVRETLERLRNRKAAGRQQP